MSETRVGSPTGPPPEPSSGQGPTTAPSVEDFLGSPTRELSRWHWLFAGDHPFPIRSSRGLLGRLIVLAKRLLRPWVKTPQNDLWERQRVFNLILLEHLEGERKLEVARRVGELERLLPLRLEELLRHNDALFARLDQKVDLYRRQAAELSSSLGAALAVVEGERQVSRSEALVAARDEQAYLELERRFRGTEAEIAERLSHYLPRLEGKGEVLDLGCGRGESLAVMTGRGIPARGVDGSASMVAQCRERGFVAEQGDVFDALATTPEGSLGGVVSFHVIEHLPAEQVDRLVRLAFRALKPGGVLILETPNPLSLVVAARNFWVDPTHRRPIHPESLKLSCLLAGFASAERLELRPFPPESRLPEVDLTSLPEASRVLGHRVNELRDRLDDLLFGYQDYAVVAEKSRPA